MSFNTLPAPTEGSWSASPIKSAWLRSGTALSSEAVRLMSSMEHSSTMRKSTSNGSSSFFLNFPCCHSNRRWIVFASRPITSAMRCAARPVGAASSTLRPIVSSNFTITWVVVVLPQPGPPVRMENFSATIRRTAAACSSLKEMFLAAQ